MKFNLMRYFLVILRFICVKSAGGATEFVTFRSFLGPFRRLSFVVVVCGSAPVEEVEVEERSYRSIHS